MKNLLLLTEEQSVWAELWDYFVNNFFSIEYREYENLQFSSSMFTLRSMIICMFIGILLASLLALSTNECWAISCGQLRERKQLSRERQ